MYEATRTQPLSVDKLHSSTPWVFVWQRQKATQTISMVGWMYDLNSHRNPSWSWPFEDYAKTTSINDSALILSLGCLWAIKVQDLLRSGFIYLFPFSVVSSLSGWGCFSCCCGRDLTLFFSAAVAWALSILLKIIKQHAIDKYFWDEFGRKSQLISNSAMCMSQVGWFSISFVS